MSVTETYYHTLVEILAEDPSAINRLDLDCGICMEKMTFDSEDEICEPDNEAGLHNHAYILPCGHMFCFSCCAKLMVQNRNSKTPHTCPTCRYDLYYSFCKCPHNLGALFLTTLTKEQTEAMELRMWKAFNLRCICLRCHMNFFLMGLTEIALYRHDCSQLIRDGQFLAVTAKNGGERWAPADIQGLRPIETLPVSSDLLRLFEMVGNGLAEMQELDPVFEFELHLYEDSINDGNQGAYLTQQGLNSYVKFRIETLRMEGNALAYELALDLAIGCSSDEFFQALIIELGERNPMLLEAVFGDAEAAENSELDDGRVTESDEDDEGVDHGDSDSSDTDSNGIDSNDTDSSDSDSSDSDSSDSDSSDSDSSDSDSSDSD